MRYSFRAAATLLVAALTTFTSASAADKPAAAVAAPPDPAVAQVIHDLGLQDSPTALRDEKGWRAPKRIVMAAFGYLGPMQASSPGVEIVVVKSPEEMAAQAGKADAILGGDNMVCDDQVLAAAKQVRWVGIYSAGVEACLGKKALERPGVTVTNMRAVAGPVMAEHTIALTFALARSLQVSMAHQLESAPQWRNAGYAESNAQAMTGKTMLIVGLGGIGLEVAKRAHGLGMKVIATRNSSHEGPDYVSYVGLSDELPTLIAQADVVVSALPLIPATTNLFDAKMFARMKKTAYFINVGRGGSVVTDDLVAALNNGSIAGAGLDVTEPEPLPPDHPLWKAKNVIITPHMSARSDLGQATRELILREQLRRFAAGDKLLSVVDFKKGY